MKARAEKEQILQEIQTQFTEAKSVVVVHYKGLTVAEFAELRNKAREQGTRIIVTKNTLARRALEGTPYENVKNLLAGPTAVAFSEDEISAAKALVAFGKNNETLKILGGAIGENALDEAGVKNVATLPTLDESRATLVGLLQAPAQKLLGVLGAPAGQVARVIAQKPEETN